MTTFLSRAETTSPATVAGTSTTGRSVRDLPRWVSHGTLALTLLAVLALYTYDLAASGYANSFYSAAVQAGSVSWKAFFYGSLDAGNSITVDKTPASLWLMALSVRIFGLSSWSILLPQALLGVASAAVLYFSVRRALSGRLTSTWPVTPARAHVAGLVAALALALTPAATLMFRFNNPDALMVFAYVVAAYCTIRATEAASRKWLAFAGIAIGIGFLAKMLQAFVLLPSLVLAYAIAAPASWRKKLVDLLTAFAAMVVSFGWYIAIVELVPASWRPYIGGSQTNSILELTFGYNGLGRLNGNETGSVSFDVTDDGTGGTSILRMFTSQSGEMVSFLIPAALILAGVALAVTGRRAYANTLRPHQATGQTIALAALLLYTTWLVINGLVFSFMAGIYHDYYTVALAPAIAGTVAIGGTILWSTRGRRTSRRALAAAALTTAVWTALLASLAGGVYMALATACVVALVVVAAALIMGQRLDGTIARIACVLLVGGALLVPASYSIKTALTPHAGSTVTAGPVDLHPVDPKGPRGLVVYGVTVSSELAALLSEDGRSYTWVAATVGGQNTANFELATRFPVMAVGGFKGTDPSLTLEQFKALVAARRIHYYVATGSLGVTTNRTTESSEIAAWVSSTFTPRTVDDVTVYDLTQGR